MMRYITIILCFLLTACGRPTDLSGQNGNAVSSWGGAGGPSTVGGASGTIKPFGTGSGLWPSGQTDGTYGSIQSPNWGSVPQQQPTATPQSILAPLLNPQSQFVPTPMPFPTAVPTNPPPPTNTPVPPQPVVVPAYQPPPQQPQPIYQPPPQQPSSDCICYSNYAAERGVQPVTRRCGEVLPGDQSVCVAPGVWQRR